MGARSIRVALLRKEGPTQLVGNSTSIYAEEVAQEYPTFGDGSVFRKRTRSPASRSGFRSGHFVLRRRCGFPETETMLVDAARESSNPNLRAIIFRQQFTQMTDIVDKTMKLSYPQLEACLALGVIKLKSNDNSENRSYLQALEQEAHAKGYNLNCPQGSSCPERIGRDSQVLHLHPDPRGVVGNGHVALLHSFAVLRTCKRSEVVHSLTLAGIGELIWTAISAM